MKPATDNELFVQKLKTEGSIKSKSVFEAFLKIDRADFVPELYKPDAYLDEPIPLGPDEISTSQPSTIAFMLEILQTGPGQKVLEIGAGSGYLTALLAVIVGSKGAVHSIEYEPGLKDFAQKNLQRYDFANIELLTGDGKKGLPNQAPFDRIISSAEISRVPKTWKRQLASGGILITPSGSEILKIVKKPGGKFSREEYPAFAFIGIK